MDDESGLVHTAHVNGGTEGNSLLYKQEEEAFGDAGYQAVKKRPDSNANVPLHIAMRLGKRAALDKENERDALARFNPILNLNMSCSGDHWLF